MRVLFAIAAVSMLAGCGSVYSLEYIARVVSHQDAGTEDFRWKNSVSIPASTAPHPLALDTSHDEQILRAIEAHLDGSTLTQFMTETSTQSLVVMRGGEIVFERYAHGFDHTSPQAVFSVSKSVLSLLVGRAVEMGAISLDAPITRYVPELAERDPRFDRITLAHLIDMRSGLRFQEEVSFPFINRDKPLVYYASDLRETVLTQARIETEPGPFLYNDYNPNLMALALERALGPARLAAMRNELWQELGAENAASWSSDSRGFPYWESGFVATPRDLAKVGQLMLDDGGSTLLSASWRDRILSYTPDEAPVRYDGGQWGYRGGWWLILRADNRHDVAAVGRFGQLIYVSPSYGIVFVRTGADAHPPGDGTFARLFYALAPALSAQTPPSVSE
ncbi:MAG: serine hydrolase [Hyphomonadaceae bacterium]